MKVKGENVVLYISIDDVWTPYACARSISFSTSTELIETSVTGSGLNATYLPTKNTASGSAEGVVAFNEDGFTTLPDIRVLQLTQQLVATRIVRTDDLGNISTDQFNMYITSVSDSGSFDGMAQFSFDFTVSGGIVQTFTPFLRFRVVNSTVFNPSAYIFYLEGEPQAGDEVQVDIVLLNIHHTFNYTVLEGDTIEDVIDALFALMDADPSLTPTDLDTGILVVGILLDKDECSVTITLA